MSIFKSELEIFDGLMDNVSSQISQDPSKLIMESHSVKRNRDILDEAQTKRKKDFQKKKMDLIGKKKIVIEAKKTLKGLYESVFDKCAYDPTNVSNIGYFEACKTMFEALQQMDNDIKGNLEQYHDTYRKYFNNEDMSPEEIAFLKSEDPEYDLKTDFDKFNALHAEKKKPLNPNSI